MSSGPDVETLLTVWWAEGCQNNTFPFAISNAANLTFGPNPPYQTSDFLAVYPQFGSDPQALSGYTIASGGAGYAVNDTIVPVQSDASGASVKVTAVDVNGAITATQLLLGGTGYSVATALPTTTSGAGTGATVNITSIAPGNFLVPQAVLQMYVNLASASLNYNRWLDQWLIGMSLFIAHFATLYLWSLPTQTNPSAAQVAQAGIAKGILVSKAVGDVSGSYQLIIGDMESWGAFNLTIFGQQLITMAKIIGIGPMYIW